ncbi:hypothetical protein HaLaN_12246, partial [Haematococcus lacustris]
MVALVWCAEGVEREQRYAHHHVAGLLGDEYVHAGVQVLLAASLAQQLLPGAAAASDVPNLAAPAPPA